MFRPKTERKRRRFPSYSLFVSFLLKKEDLLLSLSFLALAPDKLPREASNTKEGERWKKIG